MSASIIEDSASWSLPWLQRELDQGAVRRVRSHAAMKRIFDLVVVVSALPFLLPIFVLCALAIKLDSPGGPVLFAHRRTGKDGRPFAMLKFRSMVPNAEALKAQYAHLNERQWPEFKITNDPRITRVGRWLRRTSLDELPQLLNVIKGEMSLVGPRPTAIPAAEFRVWQTERLDVLPGVTGLWQVLGRGETISFDQRAALDIAYVMRRSPWLDMRILLLTVAVVLRGRGSY